MFGRNEEPEQHWCTKMQAFKSVFRGPLRVRMVVLRGSSILGCITCHTLEKELPRIAIADHLAEGVGTSQAEFGGVCIEGGLGVTEAG